MLFGSRATGTNTASSDVDIALFGDRLTLTDQARLAVALEEIPMAQSVDLLLYDSIRDRTLQEHIRNHGIEWYARLSAKQSDHATSMFDTRDPTLSSAWPTESLNELIALTLSSVDKKSKDHEVAVRLCNYLDVYNNSYVRADMDFMSATATEREIARCSLAKGDVVIHKGFGEA